MFRPKPDLAPPAADTPAEAVPSVYELERRLVVLAATAAEVGLTDANFADTGIFCVFCPDVAGVAAEAIRGAGVLLLREEDLDEGRAGPLADYLGNQPPWSDLPVLLVVRRGADSPAVAQALELFGNVTLLERPARVSHLIGAVRTALRARERQYQIRAHVAERDRAAVALRRADRRKDEFLATLAHELRNPLAPIRNSLHVLRLASARDDPSVAEVCDIMERQVEHMVRLVDDLLELSRITRDTIELRKEPVELAAMLRTAVEASRPLIEGGRHRLEVSLPAETITFEADGVRLAQVFANLLNNAAKYTEEGGRIWLTARRRGDWLVVSVRDSGIGIPATMLPMVFEMFTQVDRSLGRAQGGLGIGLALVRRLVKLHGGSIDAHSRGVGQGSRFVVRLPLPRCTAPLREQPALRHCDAKDRRVLVVDDNHDAADSLGILLRKLGTDVRVVHDGEAALAALETYRPAVVLLDLGMPGMDGFEVARRIREHPEFRDVLLIALTGWGQVEDRFRTQHAGFDHHLTKPADLRVLQEILA